MQCAAHVPIGDSSHPAKAHVDVFVTVDGGRAMLLRNDGGSRNKRMSCELRGMISNAELREIMGSLRSLGYTH